MITKKSILYSLILVIAVLMIQPDAQAQSRSSKVGLGVILGEPTGLSFKAWTSSTNAFDGGLAWSFGHDSDLYVHADYLWHNYSFFNVNEGSMPLYYGIGGRILFANDPRVGVRIPVGMEYEFEDSPVGIFFELAPILDLVPETDFDLSGGVGLRYYF